MTITFENDSDIIVYALKKVIAFARENQYHFVANCAWWIAAVIGLCNGLKNYIDNLKDRRRISVRAILTTPRDIARSVSPDLPSKGSHYRSEGIPQIDNTISDSYEVENNEPRSDQATMLVGHTRKERLALKQRPWELSRTRLGRVPDKPLTKRERHQLRAISKNKLTSYTNGRKKWYKI